MASFNSTQDSHPFAANANLDLNASSDNHPLGLPQHSTSLEFPVSDTGVADLQITNQTKTTADWSEENIWEAAPIIDVTTQRADQLNQDTFLYAAPFLADDLTGIFTVGSDGKVTTDFLFDAGGYESQMAIISLEGMEYLEPGSSAFIQEAARRGLSSSHLGHILISDRDEGAKLSGELGEKNQDRGEYFSPRTVSMTPGDRVTLMLVPNGTLSQVANQANLKGSRRALFSMAAANPGEKAQLAQVIGDLFAWEDLRLDGKSDRDYNDLIFKLQGVTGTAAEFEALVATDKDWRNLDLGKTLIDQATAADVNPPQIIASLANDTGSNNTDGITSDLSTSGLITDSSPITALRAKWDDTSGGDFVDILSVLKDDGSFALTQAQLAQIKGSPLTDGEQTLLLQAEDAAGNLSEIELAFTLDTTAPQVTVTQPNLSPNFVDMSFNELMDEGISELDNYVLKRAANNSDDQSIEIASVEQLGGQTLRLHFSAPLAAGQYELTVNPSVGDLAGNSLSDNGILLLNVEEDTESVAWQFAYDDVGRITQVIDPAGQVTVVNRTFDEQGQLQTLTRTLSDGSQVILELDDFGRLSSMTDDLGITAYGYDEFSRLTSVDRSGQPPITYTYDTEDRITSVSVGDDTTTYTYDFLGRLASMETPAGTVSYEYLTGQGQLIRTLPNGVQTIWEFEPDGNLGQLTHVSADSTILAQFTYDYGPDGLISQIQEWSPTEQKTLNYKYDKVQRLVAVEDSILGRTEYEYDAVGNRTVIREPGQDPIESTYDWANRLTTYDGEDVTYDAAGNLTQYQADPDQRSFEYDASGLLDEVTVDGQVIDYEYDGDGNLIRRTFDGNTTNFVVDPLGDIWRPLQVTDETGISTLIWEGETPLVTSKAGEEIFFLQDHLGSVRFAVDENGNIVDKFDYDAFGEPISPFNLNGLQAGFTGLFFDPGADLYLTRARGYESELGQFLQPDPIHRIPLGSQKDFSSYSYVGNDPINFVDPEGNIPVPAFLGLLGATIGSVTSLGSYLLLSEEKTFSGALGSIVSGSIYGGVFGLRLGQLGPVGGPATGAISNIAGTLIENSVEKLFDPNRSLTQDLWKSAITGAATGGVPPKPINFGGPYIGAGLKSFNARTPQAFLRQLRGEGSHGRAFWSTLGVSSLSNSAAQRAWNPFSTFFEENYIGDSPIRDNSSSGFSLQTDDLFLDSSCTGSLDCLFNDPSSGFIGGPPGDFVDLSPGIFSSSNLSVLSSTSPSNVGGIYLNSAAQAVSNLGQLSGIAIDEATGELILFSKEQDNINLPPLRLDDVATIFRSVYEEGQAPYVSIDPDPTDPQGDFMLVRHDPVTDDTYVGWTLFEADRIMKTYSLGVDNVTEEPITTLVPGYRDLFDPEFQGTSNIDESIWERFWIVPAEVNRDQAQGEGENLTLLDVTLKVNTERMILEDGVLVTAPDPSPSDGAAYFSNWFTENFDAIAQEVQLTPPAESGIDGTVSPFAETERMALITGIAEVLQEQGIYMPDWMQEYEVTPVDVTDITPGLTVTETVIEEAGDVSTETTQEIYGGASLTLETIPKQTNNPQTAVFSEKLFDIADTQSLLEPFSFIEAGETYNAVVLPTDDTQALGGQSLREVDLAIPIQGGSVLSLERSFHSFFDPDGIFGDSWTLDLPTLEQEFSTYQLSSPLKTWSARFIPDENGVLQPNNPDELSPLLVGQDNRIGTDTNLVRFQDGREWHFDSQGQLLGWTEGALAVAYKRNAQNQIETIEGWYGDNLQATIELAYNTDGQLQSATGSDGSIVNYVYDASEQLVSVDDTDGSLEYTYNENDLVTGIQEDGAPTALFTYDNLGRLKSEWFDDGTADGATLTYENQYLTQGIQVTVTDTETQATDTVLYNFDLQPLQRIFDDGTTVDWLYQPDGSIIMPITLTDGEQYTITQSGDGQSSTLQLPEGGMYSATYDATGRLTTLQQGDTQILSQEWNDLGLLEWIESPTVVLDPTYEANGVLTSLLVSAPPVNNQFTDWLETQYDDLGRVSQVSDSSGASTIFGYDDNGELIQLTSNQGSVSLIRNNDSSVAEVSTSWGYQQFNTYDNAGELIQIQMFEDGQQATIILDDGQVTDVQQFDGGVLNFSYYPPAQFDGQLNQIKTPNGLDLQYTYNTLDFLTGVVIDGFYELQYEFNDQGQLIGLRQTSEE